MFDEKDHDDLVGDTERICGTSMRTVEVPGFLRKRSISESTPTDIQVFYHFETVLSNGTRRCHPHNSRSLSKRILFQFVCSGLRGEIESIPATVLHCTSTKRRHCSTQQTVRSAADLSKSTRPQRVACIQGSITASSRLTALVK